MVKPFRGLGRFAGCGNIDDSAFCHLVTPLEVITHLKAMKNHTSPGPDGISKGALLSWDQCSGKLARIFSSWLISGTLLGAFKKCRTTLLPKASDPDKQGDVNQWRPIMIRSVILRFFSRILTARMMAASPICPRQRGFIASTGCSENLMILDGIVTAPWPLT